MENYTNTRLKELIEEINKVKAMDESADFFKGYMNKLSDSLDHLEWQTHLVMKPGLKRNYEIDSLIVSYDYTYMRIDDYGQMMKAERKNNEIASKLKELGVLEFTHIKLD